MIGVGLGVGLSRPGAGAAPAVNPNLLTKTERLDDAAWVKTNCTVTANAGDDPLGGSTADLVDLSFGAGAIIAETSGVVCVTASGSLDVVLSDLPTRFSLTGLINGISAYTFSGWLNDTTNPGGSVQLTIDAAGGFVRVSVKDLGAGMTPYVWGAKLETGSSATGDETNYGAVA